METSWILLPDTSPTMETFRKRPRRVPMVFLSPTSTRYGYGHINGVPVLHRSYPFDPIPNSTILPLN
ncbi:hypothetical protein Hanom_Chr14g01308031 [Helianthus anomalus]